MRRIFIIAVLMLIFATFISASSIYTDTLDGLPGSSYLLKTGGTMTGDLTLTLNLYLGEYLFHYGDPNTYARFRIDNIQLVAGGLFVLNGSEGTTDTIYIGDGDWDYIVIGDTTSVNRTTYTYTNGNWDFPADGKFKGDVYCYHLYASSGSVYVGDVKLYQNTDTCIGVTGISIISTTTVAGHMHISTGTAVSAINGAITLYPVGDTLRFKEPLESGGTERTVLDTTSGMDRTVYDVDADDHTDSINTYAARAYKSSASQVVATTTTAKIIFDLETFDKGSNFIHHTSSSVYYVPKTGLYRAMAQLHWTAEAKDEEFSVSLVVNGTIQAISCVQSAKAANICSRVHDLLSLSADDEVWAVGHQSTGNDRYVINGSSWTFFTISYEGND